MIMILLKLLPKYQLNEQVLYIANLLTYLRGRPEKNLVFVHLLCEVVFLLGGLYLRKNNPEIQALNPFTSVSSA